MGSGAPWRIGEECLGMRIRDGGLGISAPLQSVFNLLNGNNGKLCYEPGALEDGSEIPYPIAGAGKPDAHFYGKIRGDLREILGEAEWTQEYVQSLMAVLEMDLSYVPSAATDEGIADVSLYDHLKLTAAVAGCIYGYLSEKGITDYRDRLLREGKGFWGEDAFRLYSMDISGIQDFIYTIASKNALRTLRARSFFLEIMMEHMIDSLLQELHLTRANLRNCKEISWTAFSLQFLSSAPCAQRNITRGWRRSRTTTRNALRGCLAARKRRM